MKILSYDTFHSQWYVPPSSSMPLIHPRRHLQLSPLDELAMAKLCIISGHQAPHVLKTSTTPTHVVKPSSTLQAIKHLRTVKLCTPSGDLHAVNPLGTPMNAAKHPHSVKLPMPWSIIWQVDILCGLASSTGITMILQVYFARFLGGVDRNNPRIVLKVGSDGEYSKILINIVTLCVCMHIRSLSHHLECSHPN